MFLFLFVTLCTGFFGSRYAHEKKQKKKKTGRTEYNNYRSLDLGPVTRLSFQTLLR